MATDEPLQRSARAGPHAEHPPVALWFAAARPRTLSMAAVPVGVGAAYAWSVGASPRWIVFGVTLLSAVLIQIATNLFNDASDGERGGDGPERLGPLRVTGAGLLTAAAVRRAAVLCLTLAFLGGVFLVIQGGVYILVLGLLSMAAAYAYSGGPRPLSHGSLGELYVIAFFGLAATVGSFYLQAGFAPDRTVVAIGFALGCHAAAALLVNNVRDTVADVAVGRRTLAVRLGRAGSSWLYALLMLAPFVLVALAPLTRGPVAIWLALPFCVWLAWRFARMPVSAAMNAQLARTALAQALFAVLLLGDLLF